MGVAADERSRDGGVFVAGTVAGFGCSEASGDFERCADYVHFNSVKHWLATSPSDWRFSSLHRYIRAGILPPDWGGDGSADTSNFGERKD